MYMHVTDTSCRQVLSVQRRDAEYMLPALVSADMAHANDP